MSCCNAKVKETEKPPKPEPKPQPEPKPVEVKKPVAVVAPPPPPPVEEPPPPPPPVIEAPPQAPPPQEAPPPKPPKPIANKKPWLPTHYVFHFVDENNKNTEGNTGNDNRKDERVPYQGLYKPGEAPPAMHFATTSGQSIAVREGSTGRNNTSQQSKNATSPSGCWKPRSDILQFYQNKLPMKPENILIEDVILQFWGDYGRLERSQTYIHWLFPTLCCGSGGECLSATMYSAGVAPPLQTHEIEEMRDDPAIRARVIKVFRMMLNFYGMEILDEEKGVIARKAKGWEGRYENLNRSTHNHLRITRILLFLGEMDMEHLKLGWLHHLFQEISLTKLLAPCEKAFYTAWVETIENGPQRDEFINACRVMAEGDAVTAAANTSSVSVYRVRENSQ